MDSIKIEHMQQLFEYKQKLRRAPQLRKLFLELTLRCNENCRHCGSRCGDVKSEEMPVEVYFEFLDKISRDFKKKPMLCITGGEPLLRKEFEQIMGYAHKLGFHWGMTSNATLIDEQTVEMLKRTGMDTISVSIDGLREEHDSFRRSEGGFDRAVRGIKLLMQGGFQNVQVTTVVNHENIGELDELFLVMDGLDIDSWRVINLEPIGRALQWPGRMLTPEDYRRLFSFIREKRLAGYPVEYGCSHYLGPELEGELRDWYWLCNAGIYTASIMANGDVGACLDIERRPETVQGNIREARFRDIWENRFELFREDLSAQSEYCRGCSHADHCRGDAHHSWDYDKNEPRLCFKGMLFE